MTASIEAAVPPGPGAIVVGSFPLTAGHWFVPHHHAQHQLAWATRGVLGVTVGDDSWVLPPTLALWLPAGTVHRTGATRDAIFHSLYLEPSRCPPPWDVGSDTPVDAPAGTAANAPVAVAVGGLLAQLLRHLGRGDLTDSARQHAEAVVLDLLRPLPIASVLVPDLVDTRAQEVAGLLLADPSDARTLDAFARTVGTSRRTLSRLFVQDTGMSFDRWRTHLRLRAALPLIAEGHPVSRVAHTVGYATPSAFLAAFRRVTGTTPRRYFHGHGENDHAR